MNIQSQILKFAEKHSLKEKALASIDKVIDAHIQTDNESGLDFLDGNNRADLIYQFGRFEFQIDNNDTCCIVTKINIYSKKLYGPNLDIPIGYYEELTGLNGMHWDEFLIFDWSRLNLNIGCHIERINKTVPQRYFSRNIPEYEFATNVIHIISLVQGRQFDGAIIFLERCLDYLEKIENEEIESEYLSECLELFQRIYYFVKDRNLIEPEILNRHRIKERIKNEKLTIRKRS